MNEIGSLSYSMWICQYNIVFSPKNRGRVIYRKLKRDLDQIQRKQCE